MHTVREGREGDLGGSGKKAGNNWGKFTKDPKSVKEGKGGKKKDAEEKPRKDWKS
jgi:hypothetical protein